MTVVLNPGDTLVNLGGFKMLMPGPTPKSSDFSGMGCSLNVDNLQNSPGGSNVQAGLESQVNPGHCL